jgi:cytokine receptor domeless
MQEQFAGTLTQFKNMSSDEYVFEIKSSNDEGDSAASSRIFVPSKQYRLPKPTILKLLSDNGVYELSWKMPDKNPINISSYTVMWCESKSNSPNDCESSIDYAYVNASTSSYKLSNKSSSLNFAVAANSRSAILPSGYTSSGMVWASCTVTQKTDIGKLKTIWIRTMQPTYMELKWNLECGDYAVVKGFKIFYCPIQDPKTLKCKEEEKVIDTTEKSQKIPNLRPYTTYKIEVAMYSNVRQGPRSEPLINTTLEAAPSPPRNLIAREVRNDSILLEWGVPEFINGGRMYYEIWYNQQNVRVNHVNNNQANVFYNLTDLMPFTDYKILVVAYTVNRSEPSNSIEERTKIGIPSRVDQPNSHDLNNSRIEVTWNLPSHPAGKLDYYELQTITKKNDVTTNVRIMRLRGRSCRLKNPICKNDTDKYEFYIRAVNVVLSPHADISLLNNSYIDDDTRSMPFFSGLDDAVECEMETNLSLRLVNWTAIDRYAEHLKGNWSIPLAHRVSIEYLV